MFCVQNECNNVGTRIMKEIGRGAILQVQTSNGNIAAYPTVLFNLFSSCGSINTKLKSQIGSSTVHYRSCYLNLDQHNGCVLHGHGIWGPMRSRARGLGRLTASRNAWEEYNRFLSFFEPFLISFVTNALCIFLFLGLWLCRVWDRKMSLPPPPHVGSSILLSNSWKKDRKLQIHVIQNV